MSAVKQSPFIFLLLLFWIEISASQAMAQSAADPEWLPAFRLLQKELAPDKRTAILEVEVFGTKESYCLKGNTDLQNAKDSIGKWFTTNGITIADSIRLLPEPSMGEKIWALTTLSVSNLRTQPDHAAEMATQALMGTPVKVLEYKDGWYRVQTPDNYIGWMEGLALERLSATEMEAWKRSDRWIFIRLNGHVVKESNAKSEIVTDLVLDNILEVVGEQNGFLHIKLPDGRQGWVRKKDCQPWETWSNQIPTASNAIAMAKSLMGLPYLWGGTSPKAVDCSGLTKTSWFAQGVILARDASQQARYGGHPDASEISNLQPGDLLFFGRNPQRVTHVGMYIGNGNYIHASGLVRINSIAPGTPGFNITDRKSLVATSRILGYLNTDGITLVKDHPWYHSLQ